MYLLWMSIIICLNLCACHSLFPSCSLLLSIQYCFTEFCMLVLVIWEDFAPCHPLSSPSTTLFMGNLVTVLPHGPLWSYNAELQLSLSSSITLHLMAISFSHFISSCGHYISSQYHKKKYGTWYLREITFIIFNTVHCYNYFILLLVMVSILLSLNYKLFSYICMS